MIQRLNLTKDIASTQSKYKQKVLPGMEEIIETADRANDLFAIDLARKKDDISDPLYRVRLEKVKGSELTRINNVAAEIAEKLGEKLSPEELLSLALDLGLLATSALTVGSVNAALRIIDDKTIIPGCLKSLTGGTKLLPK